MQICLECHAENSDDALVCHKCGTIFNKNTRMLNRTGSTEPLLESKPGLSDLMPGQVIHLYAEGLNSPLTLDLKEPVLLGRQGGEPATSSFVDLDQYDALNKGVSRRHAMLSIQDQNIMLCDVGSSNHTYINGQRLIDRRDYIVHNGDNISFGRLTFRVVIK